MTNDPVDDPETLRHILANTEALLLDFDGPVCSVFAGFPAAIVADQLRKAISENAQITLPASVSKSKDPFEVLKYAAKLGHDQAYYAESTFRAHEVEAISTARPTPGSREVILKWKSTRRPLAIVSNNSTKAIESYLDIHSLRDQVDFISARATPDISLLKPSPHLLLQATEALGISPNMATLVGDSITDILAADSAGMPSIGYYNKHHKRDSLKHAGATTSVSSMLEIERLL